MSYSKLIGIVIVRDKFIENLEYCLSELDITCEEIIVLDTYDNIESSEYRQLRALFDFDCYAVGGIESIPLSKYEPDWILSLYHDEVPSKRFRYFKDLLCDSKLVNAWTSPIRYQWNFMDSYRTDKLWNSIKTPSLFKYIPEMDYTWHPDLLTPTNQPGPMEDSSVPLISSRYLTERQRGREYLQFLQKSTGQESYYTKMHYESLMDEKVDLKRLE